jgi:nicotinamidase/pyrazinamidase
MKALIVVDVQYDFLPASEEDYKNKLGGALAVKNGDKIIPVINKLLPKFDLIIFTKDWHPAGMKGFASSHKNKKPFDTYKSRGKTDTLWPDHCVQDTRGADLSDDLDFSKIKGDFYIFKKGLNKNHHPYSGFEGTDLGDFLRRKKVDDIYIVGLALDFCVKDTAIDGIKEGFKVVVIEDGTMPINEDINEVLKTFMENNINFIESWELPLFNLF